MGPRRLRLDQELVRRNLARSREQASALIAAQRVKVNGAIASKPATAITTDVAIVITDDPSGQPDYASRGGHKLAGALSAFAEHGLDPRGLRCLDAGASTGGFTDVLLRAGAREVVAVDVGYGQLIWRLRDDPRVVVRDRTNIRELTLDITEGPVDLVVGDLSFISLTKVLDALIGVTDPGGALALMVKPQFEVGKSRLGKGGVVRDPELWVSSVLSVTEAAAERGWGVQSVARSPLPGPAGNVEFFVLLRRKAAALSTDEVRALVVSPAVGEPAVDDIPPSSVSGERVEP